MKNTIYEESSEIPIIDEVDALVCGGGTSGIFAALAAAKSGRGTFLLEQEGFLGGTATSYIVNPLPEMMGKGGIIQEFMDRMADRGGYIKHEPKEVEYDYS